MVTCVGCFWFEQTQTRGATGRHAHEARASPRVVNGYRTIPKPNSRRRIFPSERDSWVDSMYRSIERLSWWSPSLSAAATTSLEHLPRLSSVFASSRSNRGMILDVDSIFQRRDRDRAGRAIICSWRRKLNADQLLPYASARRAWSGHVRPRLRPQHESQG